jgi:tetratricopeptide (TPR) repeat protein
MALRLMVASLLCLAACGGATARIHTTDPAIALANLQATIEARERSHAAGDARARPELVDLLLLRGQFLSRVSDYERAGVLADDWVAREGSGRAFLARGRTRAALHGFAGALADLDGAAARGADPDAVDAARASVLQALGRYDDALRIRRRLVRLRPEVGAIGAEAAVLSEQGRAEEAAPRFRDARASYRDASPFVLAWLEFEEGRMWMRLGELERARDSLAAAHERLPAYVGAAGHLGEVEAALGRTDRAVELLTVAARHSEDPDPAAQLARVLEDAGRTADAARWRERAAVAFGDLLARHADAFADHAAEFWLGAGHDPGRAVTLARRNAALRPTPWAFDLLARSAAAAGDPTAACQAVRDARAAGHPRPSFVAAPGGAGRRAGASC